MVCVHCVVISGETLIEERHRFYRTRVHRHTDKQTETDRQASRQIDRQTERQTERQTDRQTGRYADGQT